MATCNARKTFPELPGVSSGRTSSCCLEEGHKGLHRDKLRGWTARWAQSESDLPKLEDCILGATVLRVIETDDFNIIHFDNRFEVHAPKPVVIVHPDPSELN